MTVYHLRLASTARVSLCAYGSDPERTINNSADLPPNGTLCLHCVRKLWRLPICKKVPSYLAERAR